MNIHWLTPKAYNNAWEIQKTKNLLSLFAILFIVSSGTSQIPTEPIDVSVFNVTPTSVEVHWADPFPSQVTAGYNIYVDDVFFASTDLYASNITVPGLDKFTFHLFGVTSRDAAGNESDIVYDWYRTSPTCGVTNYWVGNSSRWSNDLLNWSEAEIANECHDVIIDNGVTVTAANDVSPNSTVYREYLVSTFEVGLESSFSVDPGAEFHVLPSHAGPYTISGTYEDPNPDCIDPVFCYCCRIVRFEENNQCFYTYGGFDVPGYYSISGNIITINFFGAEYPPPYNATYRIIDSHAITELGTADVLIKE